jgi:hypothetical protein
MDWVAQPWFRDFAGEPPVPADAIVWEDAYRARAAVVPGVLAPENAPDILMARWEAPFLGPLVLAHGSTEGGHRELPSQWMRLDDGAVWTVRAGDFAIMSCRNEACRPLGTELPARLLAAPAADLERQALDAAALWLMLGGDGARSARIVRSADELPLGLTSERPPKPTPPTVDRTADRVRVRGWALTDPADFGIDHLVRFELVLEPSQIRFESELVAWRVVAIE